MQKVVPLIPARPKLERSSIWMHHGERIIPYHTEQDAVHSAALEIVGRIEELKRFGEEVELNQFHGLEGQEKENCLTQLRWVLHILPINVQQEAWKMVFRRWNEFWEDWDSDKCIQVYGMDIYPKGHIQTPYRKNRA